MHSDLPSLLNSLVILMFSLVCYLSMYKAVCLFKWIEFSFLFSICSKSLTLLQSWSSAITVHYNNPEQICVENNRNSTLSPQESIFQAFVYSVLSVWSHVYAAYCFVLINRSNENMRIYLSNSVVCGEFAGGRNTAVLSVNELIKIGH